MRACMCVRNYILPGFNIFINAAYNLYVVVDFSVLLFKEFCFIAIYVLSYW